MRSLTAVCVALLLVDVVAAQAPVEPQLVDVRVGFDGAYKLGCWTAVELTFIGGAERLTGVVELTTDDGDGTPVRYASQPVQLTPGRITPVVVYAMFGRLNADATVAFVAADDKYAETTLDAGGDENRPHLPLPLSSEDRLIVTVGRLPTLDDATASLDLGRSRVVTANVADPTRLPTHWLGYEAVDAVVVAPDRPETFAALPPDGAQVAALLEWLQTGGRVWAAVSDSTAPLFAAGGALARLGVGDSAASVPLPRTIALEKFAGGENLQSIAAAEVRKKPLLVPRLSTADAIVDVAEGELPLVLRRAAGLGVLLVTTFHPEHPLLAAWVGRPAVVRNLAVLLGTVTADEAARSSGGGKPTTPRPSHMNLGYDDLAGQLRSALDQYEGVRVVSFFVLSIAILGYVVLVGPVDYWFVRYVLKRPELTWITFPTIVVLTSLGAYYLAVGLKGNELRVHRADVVDCDATTGLVRTTTWAGVFSPVGRAYDVQIDPASPLVADDDEATMTAWFGLPGSGLSGMHTQAGAGGWFSQAYGAALGNDGLTGVPIQVWSSKMFRGCRIARSKTTLHAPLIESADGRLNGKLKNPFAYEIAEAVLCYGSRAYEFGTLRVGSEHETGLLNVRDLQSVLQGWRVVMSANKNPVNTGMPHDPGSLDVAEIVRKMMFFTTAGGREHANLSNRFQPLLDFSLLPKLHRAVLVGRVDPDAVGDLKLTADGDEAPRAAEDRTAFVRLVIPVTPAPSGR